MLRDFTGSRYTFGEIVWPREEILVYELRQEL